LILLSVTFNSSKLLQGIIIRLFCHFTDKETPLTDDDYSSIYTMLAPYATNWRDIGTELGFIEGEMDNIECRPKLLVQAPQSFLGEMLSRWLQWAPGDWRGSTGFATRESLRAALLRANLGQLAQQFDTYQHSTEAEGRVKRPVNGTYMYVIRMV
jgi:hypothetical protein